jgi:hypothetical protein
MRRARAARARRIALKAMAYRAWYLSPATAEIPPISVLTDGRLQAREQRRQLRRAQVGQFDTVAPVVPSTAARRRV